MRHLDTDCHPPARLELCSFSGGSSSSSSQPVLNPQLFSLLNANAQRAAGVANQPFQSYDYQQTAGMTPNQQQAGTMFQGASSVGQPALQTGVNAATSATGYRAPTVSAQNATATTGQATTGLGNLSDYMNPYTNDVVNTSLNDLNRARQMSIVGNQAAATSAGAYGGSRHGVADSLTNQDFLNTAASTSANLRNQGFNAAAGLLQNDQGALNNMSQFNAGVMNNNSQFNANSGNAAQLANQSASLQGQGVNLQGAGLLNTLGNSQNANYLNGANALNQYGTQEQNTQQSMLDAAYQEFMRQQGYAPQMQQLLNQSLGLVPQAMGNSSQGNSSQFGFQLP